MHQLSFQEFAASLRPLPVRIGNPLSLGHSPCGTLWSDSFDGDDLGYRLDATDYVPLGGHHSAQLSTCVYVAGYARRVCS
jgi:hypothetical protein